MSNKSERRLPKRCEMPDLSNLNSKVILTFILNAMLKGGGPRDLQAWALVISYVRLVDKAVVEYQSARAYLEEYVTTDFFHMSPVFRATGHIETCIGTLKRAIRALDRIRRDQQSPEIPKHLPVLSGQTPERITEVRDAMEHMDERILNGQLPTIEALCLLTDDGLDFCGTRVSFTELASWVKQLHSLSESLASYVEK